MKFEAPQLILSAIQIFGLGVTVTKKDPEGVAVFVIGLAVTAALLWWGGFYG